MFARRRKLAQVQLRSTWTSNMRRRPHDSDRTFGKRGSLVFAIRDAEPLGAALKRGTATSRFRTRRIHKECSLDKGKTINCVTL